MLIASGIDTYLAISDTKKTAKMQIFCRDVLLFGIVFFTVTQAKYLLHRRVGPNQNDCGPGYWQCDNRLCIIDEFACDGDDDCFDNSDESRCPAHVEGQGDCEHYYHWECANKECVRRSSRCNHFDDCGDNSDEEGCKFECDADDFLCPNGWCVEPDSLCDGRNDCWDHGDEVDCPRSEGQGNCYYLHWECPNKYCIPQSAKCDAYDNCGDNSDEDGCVYPDCTSNQWRCDSEQCIPANNICNGHPDCWDGSDEVDCPVAEGQSEMS